MNNLEGGNEERLGKRMQLVLLGWCTPCGSKDNWGWLKFSVVPTQNGIWNILLQVDTLSTFSLVVGWFHAVQDWKSLIKLYVRPGHGSSSDHWNIRRLENAGKWSIIDGLGAHHVCVSREIWGQLEFPRVLCLNFPITQIISICPTFSPLITATGKHCS